MQLRNFLGVYVRKLHDLITYFIHYQPPFSISIHFVKKKTWTLIFVKTLLNCCRVSLHKFGSDRNFLFRFEALNSRDQHLPMTLRTKVFEYQDIWAISSSQPTVGLEGHINTLTTSIASRSIRGRCKGVFLLPVSMFTPIFKLKYFLFRTINSSLWRGNMDHWHALQQLGKVFKS